MKKYWNLDKEPFIDVVSYDDVYLSEDLASLARGVERQVEDKNRVILVLVRSACQSPISANSDGGALRPHATTAYVERRRDQPVCDETISNK